MAADSDLYFFYKPLEPRTPTRPVEFLTIREFLADEPACKLLWDLVSTQFRTRSKFLAVWSAVQYVAVHRGETGDADGMLLVSAPINWQIDYVVVKPESRGRGIAAALITTALHHAYLHKAPYVMLTAKESLRGLYESCGFEAIQVGCPLN